MNKYRDIIINLALAVLPILIIYALFEFVFFKPLIPKLSLRYQSRLPESFQMLAQVSKKSTMPHDYILILGDSYAAGWGDWLQSANQSKNKPYASHDIIHEMIGKDVVNCGMAGGSPMETLIRKPINRFRYLRKTWLYKPEDPKEILFYFYEGNDLQDNLERLNDLFKGQIDKSRIYDKSYFQNFVRNILPKSDALYYDVRKFKLQYNFVFYRTLCDAVRKLFIKYPSTQTTHHVSSPDSNFFLMDGIKKVLPYNAIQASLEASEDDMRLSFYIIGECLDFLAEFFPNSRITVVYIPAVITAYPISSRKVNVVSSSSGNPVLIDTDFVFKMSDKIFKNMHDMAAMRNINVIDTRPFLRNAASHEGFLHGPTDWLHLNRRGYNVLSEAIVTELKKM